jgi:plasmid maintenance system antidote protein VapI
MPLDEQLRDKIRDSGKSVNQLAAECGVPQPVLTRFLNGKDIRLETANKLAAYFSLKLCDNRPSRHANARAKRKG